MDVAKARSFLGKYSAVVADGGNGQGHAGSCLRRPEGRHGINPVHEPGGGQTTSGVHHGTQGPYADGDEKSLLGAHPVHELARKQASDGVEDGKQGGDGTVIGIGPMEFGGDELLVGQGKHLAVQVVHGGGDKQQAADPPAPVGH